MGHTPAGRQWAVDPSAPTCRTLEQPYRPGVNYRCVIDGDHNPVRLDVRAR